MATTLTTRPGQGLSASIAASRLLTGYTVAIEFASTSSFKTIALTKTPVVSGRQVSFTLSQTEVSNLKDSHFRVTATKDGNTVVVAKGEIEYLEPAKSSSLSISEVVASPELKAVLGAGELAYAETNANLTIASTTTVVVSGLDITVDIGDRPVMVTASVPWGNATAGATTIILRLFDATLNFELQRTVHDYTAIGSAALRPLMRRIPAGSGTKRYQLRAQLFSGTNPVALQCSSDMAWINAVEV